MKLLYFFLLILPLSFGFSTFTDTIDGTAELIKQGNIHELAKSFASTVELSVLGEENTCSPTQAESILANFFKVNQPRSVKILHRITSNASYHFAVLEVTTTTGIFRVSFSLKSSQGHFELNELRIEPEKAK